mmetsp:Transcript_31028/g.51680  ORF Transcript_31028/g.51680 Transcript_31028/m.51680 type:complete len:113 (+) Transcript_31028:1674-2012(+)
MEGKERQTVVSVDGTRGAVEEVLLGGKLHRTVYFYESTEQHFEHHTQYHELDQWVKSYQYPIYQSCRLSADNNKAGQLLIEQFLQVTTDSYIPLVPSSSPSRAGPLSRIHSS